MRGADVELLVFNWAYDHEAASDEEDTILCSDIWFTVDGQLVERGHDAGILHKGMAANCKLVCDGFWELHIEDPPDWLREKYGDPSKHLMGTQLTTQGPLDKLILSVRSLKLITRKELRQQAA